MLLSVDVLLLFSRRCFTEPMGRTAGHGSHRDLYGGATLSSLSLCACDLQYGDALSWTPDPGTFSFTQTSLVNSKFQGKREVLVSFFDQMGVRETNLAENDGAFLSPCAQHCSSRLMLKKQFWMYRLLLSNSVLVLVSNSAWLSTSVEGSSFTTMQRSA